MNESRTKSRTIFATLLVPFATTRLLIMIVLLFASCLYFDESVQEFGWRIQEPIISLRQSGVARLVASKVLNADALWYADIARNGYERLPFESTRQHNWAFFPLFPLILKLSALVTGEYGLTGSLVANVFFLLGLVQLHKLVIEFGYEADVAQRVVFYLAAFPTSYFFSLPFTESLFLFLSVNCFLYARRGRWWLAGVWGGLAAATRVTGLCLFPAILLLHWQQHRSFNAKVLWSLLIPAGIVPYMIFLHRITGNAFAFLNVQAAWGHGYGFFLRPLWDYVKSPADINFRWDFRFLNFLAAILGFGAGLTLLKRRDWTFGAYTLLSIVLPLSAMRLQSLTRYTMVAFPVFIVLAQVGKSEIWDQIIRVVFLFALGTMTLLFALHFSMAMS